MPATAPRRTSSSETTDGIRKRVGKACDRCRLKKSKCDGSHPCTRCKADNAICVFGERKKSNDKVYPKGYVEMLEQQQSQLVAGLQETYRRLLAANLWPGEPLSETSGHPLTHDILASLDLLEPKNDESDEPEPFEEDCQKLQQRLISKGASLIRRRSSVSSDSDHSLPRKHARTSSHSSVRSTPLTTDAAPVFDENLSFQTASPSPVSQSPVPKLTQLRSPIKPSPLHHEAIPGDDFLVPSWQEQFGLHSLNAPDVMRSNIAIQAPVLQDNFHPALANYGNSFDPSLEYDNMMSFGSPRYPATAQGFGPSYNTQDWVNEPMDVDFSKFVQVST